MNTTTRASFCRTRPNHRILLAVITVLMALTGCAAPQGLAPVAPTAEPQLVTSELVVHTAPKAERAPLPTPRSADAWLDVIAPTKAKEDTAGGAGAASEEGTDAALEEAEAVAPTPRACPFEGERVLLVGDSLGAGLGPHIAKRARACNTKFFVHGVVGSHVTEWTQPGWLKAQLMRAKPTVVLVSLGGNDFIRHDGDRVEKAIAKFVTTVRDSGAELRWISPPSMPFPDKVGARDMWQAAIAGEVNVDWYPTENLEIARSNDNIHPTIREYDRLAGVLWQWMVNTPR